MNPKGGITLSPIQPTLPPMNQEEQASELMQTVKCKLGPSKVHGVGVVALRDLKKGEQVFCGLSLRPRWYTLTYANIKKHFDKVHPEIRDLILDRWPQVVNGAPFLSPNYDARLTSFMNHSDNPNYDPKTDQALKDIKEGEELFEDYRQVPNYHLAFPWLDKKSNDTISTP